MTLSLPCELLSLTSNERASHESGTAAAEFRAFLRRNDMDDLAHLDELLAEIRGSMRPLIRLPSLWQLTLLRRSMPVPLNAHSLLMAADRLLRCRDIVMMRALEEELLACLCRMIPQAGASRIPAVLDSLNLRDFYLWHLCLLDSFNLLTFDGDDPGYLDPDLNFHGVPTIGSVQRAIESDVALRAIASGFDQLLVVPAFIPDLSLHAAWQFSGMRTAVACPLPTLVSTLQPTSDPQRSWELLLIQSDPVQPISASPAIRMPVQ